MNPRYYRNDPLLVVTLFSDVESVTECFWGHLLSQGPNSYLRDGSSIVEYLTTDLRAY